MFFYLGFIKFIFSAVSFILAAVTISSAAPLECLNSSAERNHFAEGEPTLNLIIPKIDHF